MILDTTFFMIAIPAVIFAGISKGGFGSGAAFVAAPLLALIVDPALAVGLMLPLLMLIDAATLKPYWKQWSWSDTRLLVLGAAPGVALGALFWRIADADLLRIFLGVISLAFVAFQLARARNLIRIPDRPFAPIVGLFAGAIGGFTSFVSHAGGPPVAVYLLARGLNKTTYQATTVITFWAVNIFKAIPYAILGIFTSQTLLAGLYLAPAALFGAWLGVKAHRIIPERPFFLITYVLLTLTGTKLIFDALT
ncbi:Sulfite exporter TauE/SafE [Boseongicola aestuarii]|uniref:Probable membrane transporter protein n=2 Tax=Boseongicola aestuarii TaxID=1470561 RepID=A0A238IWL0_9RHOB|nr:Sulfite exporter TauE/SafE [Boseongicola aestuarii]